jgi:hypothetical protein
MTTAESLTVGGVFINLPVSDLPRSLAFYRALGFALNPQFSDDTAACVVLGENMCVMLLTHDKFRQFTSLPIADASRQTQLLTAISLASRAEVDRVFAAVLAHGGRAFRPTEDLGFMYTRAFADPDGHAFEPFYMDMSAFPGAGG